MRILILTDSRGYCPGPTQNWVNLFINKNKNHNIVPKNWDRGRITTIFEQVHSVEKENKKYNLIIVQSGFHDYIHTWSKKLIELKLKGADPKFEQHIVNAKNNKFRYVNDNLVFRYFRRLKKFTDNILFITVHYYDSSCIKECLHMNKIYSLNSDVFVLPIHKAWRNISTEKDNIHYNEYGDKFISDYISRYIKRYKRTISDYLI